MFDKWKIIEQYGRLSYNLGEGDGLRCRAVKEEG